MEDFSTKKYNSCLSFFNREYPYPIIPLTVSSGNPNSSQQSDIICFPTDKYLETEVGAPWLAHIFIFGALFFTLSLFVILLVFFLKRKSKVHKIVLLVGVFLLALSLSRGIILIHGGYGTSSVMSGLTASVVFSLGEPCLISALWCHIVLITRTLRINFPSQKLTRHNCYFIPLAVIFTSYAAVEFSLVFCANKLKVVQTQELFFVVLNLTVTVMYAMLCYPLHKISWKTFAAIEDQNFYDQSKTEQALQRSTTQTSNLTQVKYIKNQSEELDSSMEPTYQTIGKGEAQLQFLGLKLESKPPNTANRPRVPMSISNFTLLSPDNRHILPETSFNCVHSEQSSSCQGQGEANTPGDYMELPQAFPSHVTVDSFAPLVGRRRTEHAGYVADSEPEQEGETNRAQNCQDRSFFPSSERKGGYSKFRLGIEDRKTYVSLFRIRQARLMHQVLLASVAATIFLVTNSLLKLHVALCLVGVYSMTSFPNARLWLFTLSFQRLSELGAVLSIWYSLVTICKRIKSPAHRRRSNNLTRPEDDDV